MNPALLIALIQEAVMLAGTLANKPTEASKVNGALSIVSGMQVMLAQLSNTIHANRKPDGSIDQAGWDAVHAYVASNKAEAAKKLGL